MRPAPFNLLSRFLMMLTFTLSVNSLPAEAKWFSCLRRSAPVAAVEIPSYAYLKTCPNSALPLSQLTMIQRLHRFFSRQFLGKTPTSDHEKMMNELLVTLEFFHDNLQLRDNPYSLSAFYEDLQNRNQLNASPRFGTMIKKLYNNKKSEAQDSAKVRALAGDILKAMSVHGPLSRDLNLLLIDYRSKQSSKPVPPLPLNPTPPPVPLASQPSHPGSFLPGTRPQTLSDPINIPLPTPPTPKKDVPKIKTSKVKNLQKSAPKPETAQVDTRLPIGFPKFVGGYSNICQMNAVNQLLMADQEFRKFVEAHPNPPLNQALLTVMKAYDHKEPKELKAAYIRFMKTFRKIFAAENITGVNAVEFGTQQIDATQYQTKLFQYLKYNVLQIADEFGPLDPYIRVESEPSLPITQIVTAGTTETVSLQEMISSELAKPIIVQLGSGLLTTDMTKIERYLTLTSQPLPDLYIAIPGALASLRPSNSSPELQPESRSGGSVSGIDQDLIVPSLALPASLAHLDSFELIRGEKLSEFIRGQMISGGSDPIKNETRMRVSGVVCHLGTSESNGHYVAYRRTSEGTWLKFDDDKTVKVLPNSTETLREIEKNAYLFHLEKIAPVTRGVSSLLKEHRAAKKAAVPVV